MAKVLRKGSKGPFVKQWQTFLRGQGYFVLASGEFDAATEAATRAFQTKRRIDIDGVVGNQCLTQAAALGFELVDLTHDPVMAYPALPAFPALTGNAGRQALFGKFAYVPDPAPTNPENIRITDDWEKLNIVKVTIPQLVGVRGARADGVVRFHRLAAKQLSALWLAWEKAGLIQKVLSYEGGFNARFIRGSSTTLSNHAFGSAFDINYKWNKLGAQPAARNDTGSVFELVPLAHKFGFYWGGHFTRRDGMHFEVAKLL